MRVTRQDDKIQGAAGRQGRRLTPRRIALVAAAKTGSPAFTIWPNETAPKREE